MDVAGAGGIRAGLASPNAPGAETGGAGAARSGVFKLPRHHGQPLSTLSP